MTGTGTTPATVRSIPDFWDRLHMAGSSLLVLDYDGTIAPFRTERMEALPLPGIAYLLEKIREKTHGSLAIMSGRPVSEILYLLGDLCIMTVGGHGSELRFPDGTMLTIEPTGLQRKGLDEALETVAGKTGEHRLERKAVSVALHTRGLEEDEANRLEGLARKHGPP
jgi:trehalose-phosphatase